MKVGLICPYNMFRGGGVQEVVLALRDGIIARGHQAYIITPQPTDYKGVAPEGYILIGGAVPIRVAKTSAQISASVDINALEAMLKREKFDILHFHEPWNPMLSRQILLRSDAIHIGTFHAAMSERRTSRTVEKVITPYTKSILKYLDVMTAVSVTATNYVHTLTKRKVVIVPNGIDLHKYRFKLERESSGTAKTILYIGRLEKRKGLRYLLQSFLIINHIRPDFRLLIAGDGPEREKLESFVSELGIRNVSFLGYISEERKLQLLQEADIFCSPALYGESFGIVLLEAMASGCVAVAGNNSGYETVLNGRGQLSIVNPKDAPEFARRLILLATDPALRKAWCEWAQNEVKKYDYDKVIDQYVAVYEAAYAKKHR
jgi:phosphatidyl-myo-inositol alpha-mannosyltransferase